MNAFKQSEDWSLGYRILLFCDVADYYQIQSDFNVAVDFELTLRFLCECEIRFNVWRIKAIKWIRKRVDQRWKPVEFQKHVCSADAHKNVYIQIFALSFNSTEFLFVR